MLLSSVKSWNRFKETFTERKENHMPSGCLMELPQLLLWITLPSISFSFGGRSTWISLFWISVTPPNWISSWDRADTVYQKREGTKLEVFSANGRSRGPGLLIFTGGWVRLNEAEAKKGSISQGETLSGLWMVVGSSYWIFNERHLEFDH